nr:hypothetical protein GCM10025730_06910 [Promicromonospora thailandica]
MTAVTAVAARAAAPADTTPRPPTPRAVVGKVVWVVAVVLISVTTVMPLLWTLATSLKPEGEILSSYLQLLPSNPTLANYVALFTDGPFGRYLANSAIIALGGVATNLFFGGLAGYALAKLSFRGRGVVFSMFLGSMMVPGIITMVPTFLVLRRFPLVGGNDLFGEGGAGFINSYGAVLIPFAAGPFAVFFMRQFFQALPDELGDAARIDGASEFRIFWSVYLPWPGRASPCSACSPSRPGGTASCGRSSPSTTPTCSPSRWAWPGTSTSTRPSTGPCWPARSWRACPCSSSSCSPSATSSRTSPTRARSRDCKGAEQ